MKISQVGDMHIRLSYAGTKPDYDQMKEDKAKFLRKLRAEFKKAGEKN